MQRKVKLSSGKREKGQVLVILALTIVGLVAIMGLAIDMGYMYVSYARLRRSVDSAALSATSQFKRGATPATIYNAAQQFMDLNNEPTNSIKIENCYWAFDGSAESDYPAYVDSTDIGGNPAEHIPGGLCTNPPRKLIRVRASEDVPTFFLAVMGWRSIPITAEAISEAASLEMVMVIDQSESMAWYEGPPNLSTQIPHDAVHTDDYPLTRDPAYCNLDDSCHPFHEVKVAAQDFVDSYIYYPYDRVAIVSFAKHATIYNPVDQTPITSAADIQKALTNRISDLDVTIQSLDVTEAARSCMHNYDDTVGSYGGPGFPNGYDIWNQGWFSNPADHPIPWSWTSAGPDEVPCRLYDVIDPDGWPSDDPVENHIPIDSSFTMLWRGFDCPQGNISHDFSRCWTSNIGEGLADAAQVYKNTPDLRQQALWVTLLLTDGNANAAYYADPLDPTGALTNPYCPKGTEDRHYIGMEGSPPTKHYQPYCRDTDSTIRHCLNPSAGYECEDQVFGTLDPTSCLPVVTGKFYWKCDWYSLYSQTNATVAKNGVDPNKYDADDYARDQADALSDGAHVSIFAVGLGDGVNSDVDDYVEPGTPPAGLALLQYIAQKGGTDTLYQANNANLPSIFLAIANKIATRLTH